MYQLLKILYTESIDLKEF